MSFRTHLRLTRNLAGYRSIFHFIWSWAQFTHGNKTLYTLLVKYYNDFLDRQSCGRNRGRMTYLRVGDLFCYPLGTTYDDFEESRRDKSFLDMSISYLEKAGKNHPKPVWCHVHLWTYFISLTRPHYKTLLKITILKSYSLHATTKIFPTLYLPIKVLR